MPLPAAYVAAFITLQGDDTLREIERRVLR